MTDDRPHLHALAARCGIWLSYRGYGGGQVDAQGDTLEALLRALGFDASSEQCAEQAVRVLQAGEAQPGLAPVRIVSVSAPDLGTSLLQLHPGTVGAVEYRVELTLEQGGIYTIDGESHPEHDRMHVPVPTPPELGVGEHRLRCTWEALGNDFTSDQDLIVTPARCIDLTERIGDRRAAGVWGHLYSLWSERSWGIGDLRDLRRLIEWAGGLGLDFVGINPLHATDHSAREVSPYYPLSRRYRDPMYLDPEHVCERAFDVRHAREGTVTGGDATLLRNPELQALRSALAAEPRVDYRRMLALKRPLLLAAHRAFLDQHVGSDSALARAHRRYRGQHGLALERFAVFNALRDHLVRDNPAQFDFRSWPQAYRDPSSAAVVAFVAEHRDAIDFHAFLQCELDEQLSACAGAAREAHMPIGIYGDLALGDAPFSADVWSQPELYAQGVNIGAPPDPFSDSGQEWGLVPFHPLALRADRYRTMRALFRQALRHTGLLRIDHVMGLGRQFWVPYGRPASAGAYVTFPLSDLLGLLALESHRAGALVIGEDLGVVPDGFRERMAEHSVLRSQVLYFERGWHGQTAPRHYARNAIATVSTHDLPPLIGYVEGRDLLVRRRAGNIASDDALAQSQREREQDITSLLALLRAEGLLPHEPAEPAIELLVEAVQLLLASAASRLVGVALDDLTLERDALNTPATFLPEEPNWSRRSRASLEQIAADPRIRVLIERVVSRAREE